MYCLCVYPCVYCMDYIVGLCTCLWVNVAWNINSLYTHSFNEQFSCVVSCIILPLGTLPIWSWVALSTMLSTSNDQEQDKLQYIRPYMKQLFLLCRPSNFPIVTLFHILGVHISLQLFQELVSTSHSLFLPLLKNPSMLMVLLSLLLVTSTSMITNDYYDARDGVDG